MVVSSGRCSYNLSIAQVEQLDETISSYYGEWMQGMSDDIQDTFFLERQPISVSQCYGQNSDMDPPGSNEGRDAMARNHDMALIRNFSFATAVHAM